MRVPRRQPSGGRHEVAAMRTVIRENATLLIHSPSMTTIADLPVEIIDRIADHFAKAQDLFNVRLTCRLFSEIFCHRVFRNIVLDFHQLRNIQRLIELASEPSDVHFYARKLEIRRLAPAASEFVLQRCVEGAGTWGYPLGSTQSRIHQGIQAINQHLPSALRHFHHLQDVSWKIGRVDGDGVNMPIMDLLCSQQNLRKVHITMASHSTAPHPDFGRLSKLVEFAFNFPSIHTEFGLLFRGVAQVLRNSPDLSCLGLQLIPAKYIQPDLIGFDQIYKSISSLRQLKTLELAIPSLSGLNEFAVFNNLTRLTALVLHPTNHTSGWDGVWKSLRDHRIHLKTIGFNIVFMDMNFIDYLKSYQGVEELNLSNYEEYFVDGSVDRTVLGVAFFEALEANHRDSIVVLETSFYSMPDPWEHVERPYARFPKLEITSA